MFKAGYRLLRESGRILLEAAPAGLDPDTVAHRLLETADVIEVHDLHLWLITSGQPAISAHILVAEGADCHQVRVRLEDLLTADYRITHATLQVDHASEHDTGHDTVAADARHCREPHGAVHRHQPHAH